MARGEFTKQIVGYESHHHFGPKGRNIPCRGCKASESSTFFLESPGRGDTADARPSVSPLPGLCLSRGVSPGALQPRQRLCQPSRACDSKTERPARKNSCVQQAGFTLLELMLALGLTTIILLAISMAVDLHLRSLDTRRKQLEESQLARAILKIIADDIRNTVLEYEQDLSGLEEMISNAAEGAGASGGGETSAEGGGGAPEESSSELDSELAAEATTASLDLAGTVTLPTKPGIYGNQYQLQIDVSRLPRFDEYQSMLAANNATLGISDIPSDIKTVTYYVLSGDTAASASGMTATNQDILTSTDPDVVQRGLVRRQLDRAVSQYALANGLMSGTDDVGEVVAAEVASIEFQYFDGIEWRYEWDTEVEGTLPLAIQIIMLLEAPSMDNLTADASQIGTSTDLEPSALHYYRLLVPVATGQAAEEEDTSLEAAGI